MEINNRFAAFIWNNFDYGIRFAYCRLGWVSRVINRILFWKLYSSDFKALDEKFEKMKEVLDEQNMSIKGKTVLELGPGNSYINAYNFLMMGAKKVILVDKYPRLIKTDKQMEFFKEEIDYITQKYGQKLPFIKNGKVDSKYIQFIDKDLTEAEVKDVDFIFSNSVLEHIRNVEDNIKAMSLCLNKNGYMLHNIDLRDHYNFNKPFLFYKYSDNTWNKYLTKEGISYTNRWRYDDFMKRFQENGFKTIYEKKTTAQLEDIKLDDKFALKKKRYLEVMTLQILLQKSVKTRGEHY